MIATEGLKYSYDSDNSFHFPDIYCDANDILLVLGRSGVGKTTLLHLIGGLMPVKEGRITIQGHDLHLMKGSRLDQFRGRKIGIIFQQPHFIEAISVLENLNLARTLAGLHFDSDQAMQILQNLGIAAKAHSNPNRLSQGEKQRLSIARAIVNQPAVILADEPTSALDDHHTKQVFALLRVEAGLLFEAVIVVTHDSRLKNSISNQIMLNH